jgi:hypothetical protein
VVLIDMHIDCFIFEIRCIYDMFIADFVDMYIFMYITHVYYVFHIMLWLLLFDL